MIDVDDEVIDFDLHPLQRVCTDCHLAYWEPLGDCPECEWLT